MKIKRFENYKYSKLFCYILTLYRINENKEKLYFLKVLKRWGYSLLVCKFRFFVSKGDLNNPIWFILPENRMRNDMRQMISDVEKTIPNEAYCEIANQNTRKFDLKRTITLIVLDLIWFCQLSRKYKIGEAIQIISYLNDFIDIDKSLNNIAKTILPKLITVRYDSSPYMNFVSQRMKLLGVSTSTLQHGIMLAQRSGLESNCDFSGVEFNGFVSDYFLAWNEFSKSEGIKQGISEKHFYIVGISKCLFKPQLHHANTKIIGIILDGQYEEEHNKPMIELVKKLAKKQGYTYILRYHPDFRCNEYNFLLDENGSNCPKEKNLETYINEVDLCVLANSTVLFELEYYNKPFIRYSMRKETDKFIDYPVPSFSNESEMNDCFKKIGNIKISRDTVQQTILKHSFFYNQFITH